MENGGSKFRIEWKQVKVMAKWTAPSHCRMNGSNCAKTLTCLCLFLFILVFNAFLWEIVSPFTYFLIYIFFAIQNVSWNRSNHQVRIAEDKFVEWYAKACIDRRKASQVDKTPSQITLQTSSIRLESPVILTWWWGPKGLVTGGWIIHHAVNSLHYVYSIGLVTGISFESSRQAHVWVSWGSRTDKTCRDRHLYIILYIGF